MLDRIGPRAVLVAALLAGLGSAAAGPAVPAAAAASPAGSASPVGGAQLAGRGLVVNYPSRSAPRLPGTMARCTGQNRDDGPLYRLDTRPTAVSE